MTGPWHTFWQSRTGNLLWRALIAIAGTTVILTGIALLPLPGPGWLVIIAGLAILATEFAWARSAVNRVKSFVATWTAWVGRQHLAVRLLIGGAALAAAATAITFTALTWL